MLRSQRQKGPKFCPSVAINNDRCMSLVHIGGQSFSQSVRPTHYTTLLRRPYPLIIVINIIIILNNRVRIRTMHLQDQLCFRLCLWASRREQGKDRAGCGAAQPGYPEGSVVDMDEAQVEVCNRS